MSHLIWIKCSVILLILRPVNIFPQPFKKNYSGIDILKNGYLLANPFNGGVINGRFQFADIDNDGDYDLFLLDESGKIFFYKNKGNPLNYNLKLVDENYKNLQVNNWFCFVDIDNDGDLDLFTAGNFQMIRFFRNIGSPISENFVLEINELHTYNDSIMYSELNSIPTFTDIDADGDFDFFTGSSLGTITYY